MTYPVVHTEKGFDQEGAAAETANAAPDATPTDAERAAAELAKDLGTSVPGREE